VFGLNLRGAAVPFLISAFVMDICVVTLRTTVPLLADSLSASPLTVGLIATTMSLVYTLTSLAFGVLSDRIGRTAIILASFPVYAAAALLMSQAGAIWHLFLLISVIGVGMGMFWPIIEAWIADAETTDPGRAITRFCIAWSSGAMIGPVVAGLLLGGSLAFDRALMGVGVFSMVAFFILLGRKREGTHTGPATDQVDGGPVPRWILMGALVALFSCWMVQSTSYTFFPLLTSSLGMGPETMGFILFSLGATRTLVFVFLMRPLPLAKMLLLMRVALVTAACACPIFLLSSSKIAFVGAFSMFGAAVGAIYAISLRFAIRGAEGRGSRTGLFEAVIGASSLVSPLGSGLLANVNLSWAFLFNLVVICGSLVVFEAIHLKRTGQKDKHAVIEQEPGGIDGNG
jgi:MFS family permease